MPRVFSPRAEPLRRGAADEGVDAAADDDDDGHRCEHAHDEDDVRRLPSSSDAGCDDQLSGLAGVQMRSHVGSLCDGVDDDDDDDDDDYDDDDGVVFPPASDKSDDEKGAKASGGASHMTAACAEIIPWALSSRGR